MGYSPRGRKESDTTEQLHFHFRFPANQVPLLKASQQLFADKMLPQPAGGRKCFLRVLQILSMCFYAARVNKLSFHWQKCVDCRDS